MGEERKNHSQVIQKGAGRYHLPGEGSEGEFGKKKTEASPVRTLQPGEWLFRAGQPARCFWMIKSGRIAQHRGGIRLNELGPRRFLGMRAFLLQGKFETSAQATESSEVVELDQEFLQGFLQRPDAVLAFLREQERELVRLAEEGAKRETGFAALRQRIVQLETELKRGQKAGEASNFGLAERILRLITPDIRQAAAALEVLARDQPTLWGELLEKETFVRLFEAITRMAEHLRSVEFTRR